MTATSLPHDPVACRLFTAGNGVLVCRYPVATDLPIPLVVTVPPGVSLLTWAFTGFGASDSDSNGLLVLHDTGTALAQGGTLTLETHFREVDMDCPKPRPIAELTAPARAALGEAVLAAVTPETLDALAMLFPLLAPPFADAPVPEGAPRLALASDDGTTAILSGTRVPNYLLLRAGTTWSCARVSRAELRFGPAPEVRLTLETVWGRPRGLAVGQALLLETGRVVPAAIGKPRR